VPSANSAAGWSPSPLVEGGDLCTGPDGQVFMRTISGLAPVHVIYENQRAL